jgi:hypothetical protein
MAVVTVTEASVFELFSLSVLMFTVAELAEISGVVMQVPHWLTWTGEVFVSQTFR